MKTSQQRTSQSGEEKSTFSREASHANLSVMPGSEKARMMTAISGRSCIEPLTKSNPIGLWLKTLVESSRWSSKARFLEWRTRMLFSQRITVFDDTNSEAPSPSNESAETFKSMDIPSSLCLYRLVPLEPPTVETECSSLRTETFLKTPCAADSFTDNMKSKGVSGTSGTLAQEVVSGYAEKHRGLLLPTPLAVEREHPDRVAALKATGATRINSRANGEQRPNGLMDALHFYGMLPTPTAIEGVKYTNAYNPDSQMGQSLSAMAGSGLLPTPRANVVNGCDLNNPKLAERNKGNLEEEVAKMLADGLLPTPTASLEKQSHSNLENIPRQEHNLHEVLAKVVQKKQPDAVGGTHSRLSPLFTEEMMGFPLMWTALPFLSQNGEQNP